jgi:hypothetical protein
MLIISAAAGCIQTLATMCMLTNLSLKKNNSFGLNNHENGSIILWIFQVEKIFQRLQPSKMNESDISLFDFLDCRFQIERARGVVGVGVILLIGHFKNGTVEAVNKIVHFTGLVTRAVCFVEPA